MVLYLLMVEIAYLPVSPDRYAIVLMNGMDEGGIVCCLARNLIC